MGRELLTLSVLQNGDSVDSTNEHELISMVSSLRWQLFSANQQPQLVPCFERLCIWTMTVYNSGLEMIWRESNGLGDRVEMVLGKLFPCNGSGLD